MQRDEEIFGLKALKRNLCRLLLFNLEQVECDRGVFLPVLDIGCPTRWGTLGKLMCTRVKVLNSVGGHTGLIHAQKGKVFCIGTPPQSLYVVVYLLLIDAVGNAIEDVRTTVGGDPLHVSGGPDVQVVATSTGNLVTGRRPAGILVVCLLVGNQWFGGAGRDVVDVVICCERICVEFGIVCGERM